MVTNETLKTYFRLTYLLYVFRTITVFICYKYHRQWMSVEVKLTANITPDNVNTRRSDFVERGRKVYRRFVGTKEREKKLRQQRPED